MWAGVVLAAAGEGVRKAAIVTAGRAFTHDLAPSRVRGHSLVTHGVSSLARHPGYLGWTLWAVGTQAWEGFDEVHGLVVGCSTGPAISGQAAIRPPCTTPPQVTLGNALCALLFAVLALRFFAARVPVEERLLLQFFGRDFTAYAARVPTWMPGVP